MKFKCPDCGKEHDVALNVKIRQRMIKQQDGDFKEEIDIVEISQIRE